MTEPRKATAWDMVRRTLGYSDENVIQPQWMNVLSPTPGEVYEQGTLRDRYRNNAISRSMILSEQLRRRRLAEAKKKKFYDALMPTYGDAGGVPEGRPSYIRENTITKPSQVYDAVQLHKQMNKPKGKVQL